MIDREFYLYNPSMPVIDIDRSIIGRNPKNVR